MQEEQGRFQLGEYWLSRRPNSPVWCITWFDPFTRQTRRRSTSERDFERAKVALASHYVEHAGLKEEDPGDLSLSFVLDRYWARHASKIASHETQKAAIAKWREFWGDATISELGIAKQEEFIKWLESRTYTRGKSAQQRRLSAGTVARQFNVGAAALEWARQKQEIKYYPALLKRTDDTRRERVLSLDEASALFNAAFRSEQHLFRWMLLAFATGARPNATLWLQPRPPMIDLETRRLNLLPPGRRQNKKRQPILPIGLTLLPWLRLWARPESLIHQGKRGRLVHIDRLITYRGRPLISIRQGFDTLRARAGITDPTVTPGCIRHTMITWLVREGVDEWEREIWIGHRAPGSRTTAGYVHLDPSYLQNAAAAIERYFDMLAPKLDQPLRVSGVRGAKDAES